MRHIDLPCSIFIPSSDNFPVKKELIGHDDTRVHMFNLTTRAKIRSLSHQLTLSKFFQPLFSLSNVLGPLYTRVVMGILITLTSASVTSAQSVAIKFPITIQDSRGHSTTMDIGVHPLATYCQDDNILQDFCDTGKVHEFSAYPLPPNDTIFDARFVDPRGYNADCMDQGLFNNIHQFASLTQIDTFEIDFRNTIGYPFAFSWPAYLSYYCDSIRMRDVYGNYFNVNMFTQSSYQISQTYISSVWIIIYGYKEHQCPPGISGNVFNDYNSNGIIESGEPGISNWRIRISGPVNDSVLTDGDGFYSFNNLPSGTYTITEAPQAGWTQTYPGAGSYTVSYALENFSSGNDFANFRGGSLGGMKFDDQNKNGTRDLGEPGLSDWTINLTGPLSDQAATVQATTDVNGNYLFSHLRPGTYVVSEVQQDDWVQTSPGGDGTYTVNITTDEGLSGNDFGNVLGVKFTGVSGGSYSDPSNWPNNQVPTSNDIVIIPTSVIKDPPTLKGKRLSSIVDSVQGIRILAGGSLISQAGAFPFAVNLKIEIDPGGTLEFPQDDTSASILCYGDWINNGTFHAGSSTVSFLGSANKVLVDKSSGGGGGFKNLSDVGGFKNLSIEGPNTSANSNIFVTDQLLLQENLQLQMDDTLFIENSSPDAIADTALILAGTISRKILAGETGAYRFESPKTFLQFDGTGNYPTSVIVTTFADTVPRSFSLPWQVVKGTVNQSEHTVAADSVRRFSKWSMGIAPTAKSTTSYGEPRVGRFYRITNNGGSGFMAHLQLRYDASEILPSTNESSLQLLRGPVLIDSLANRWNMISPPLISDETSKDSLFPTATSQAFAFQGSYTPTTDLQFGKGYWLKFPSAQQVQIVGIDVETESLAVTKGWNLIGSLSYPISAASVHPVSPLNITGQFWGYSNRGYRVADSLKPLRGYWVRVSADGKIVLSAIPNYAKTRFYASQLEEFSSLSFRNPSGDEQRLYFGSKGNIDLQQFEMPPVPPAGIFDVRYSTQRLLELVVQKKEQTIPVLISSAEYPVTVNWEMKTTTHASLIVNGKEFPLGNGPGIQIPNSASSVVLKFTASPILPEDFRLEQNYPNPFNPSTTIRYYLPVTSRVMLKVYNLLGQEVETLVDGIQDQGQRSVQWHSEGKTVATGVYFYRLVAADVSNPGKSFTQVRKMLLMK